MSLRKKITLLFTILNLLIAACVGSSVYYTSKSQFIHQLMVERWNLGEAIANFIDPGDHDRFTDISSLTDPAYKRYQQLLAELIYSFPNINYLYTISYNKEDDGFIYVVDGEIVEDNTVWLESEQLALESSVHDDGSITINHDASEYHTDVSLGSAQGEKDFQLSFKEENGKRSIYINETKGFTVESIEPFEISTTEGPLNVNERVKNIDVMLDDKLVDFEIALSLKGQPASDPGGIYVDTPDVIQGLREVLVSRPNKPTGRIEEGAYGKFLVVYVPYGRLAW